MEGASAIALALIILAGGGVTGAALMTDAGDWMGHGMMGDGRGMMGADHDECPYQDSGDAPCFRGADQMPEECEEHSLEDCPYHEEGEVQRRGGCCD
jgi:hypothetical protein